MLFFGFGMLAVFSFVGLMFVTVFFPYIIRDLSKKPESDDYEGAVAKKISQAKVAKYGFIFLIIYSVGSMLYFYFS